MSEGNFDKELRERYKKVRHVVKSAVQTGMAHPNSKPSDIRPLRRGAFLAAEAVEHEASIDPLTGGHNRKGFETALKQEVILSQELKLPLSLVYLDANNLKKINDTQGHAAGDEYLRRIGKVLNIEKRAIDEVARVRGERVEPDIARWGGDEFAVILFGATEREVNVWWQRIAEKFREENISIGAGSSTYYPNEITKNQDEIIAQIKREADKALYAAKPLSKSNSSCKLVTYSELPTDN